MSASSTSRYVCLICRNPIPHAGAECPHCLSRATALVGATPGVLAAVFAVMVVLIIVTFRLDRTFDRERVERGHAHANLAKTAADYGSYPQAIEHYREALLHIRDEASYRRGLAVALYYAGRYQEAESQLRNLRSVDPTDAVANRLLARLSARAGNDEEAISFYRTATYGRWPRNPEQNRLDTRFELVDFLEQRPGRQAINELLAMLQEEPTSARLSRRIAERLLENGAAAEARQLLERLVAAEDADADLYAELAKARFQTADYAEAHEALEKALAGAGNDRDLLELEDLLHDVLALDPTQQGLRTSERLRRSHTLLERATAYIGACAGTPGPEFVGPPPPVAMSVSSTMARALQLLDDEQPQDAGEAVEARVMTAVNLWRLRDQVCTGVWDEDDPLRVLMRRLSQ